jgi:hypothetical protein
MIAGESDPRVLVGLVNYRVHADRQKIVDALQGRLTDHHRCLLRMHLAHVKQLDVDIEMLDLKTDQQLEPLRTQLQLLKTIPGVDTVAAHVLLAEIGADMSRFPSAGHLVSWAGLCPRNEKSAGKSFNTRIRNGNPWLKSTLVQSARAGARTRSSYLRAQYHRLSARRGKNKATIAVAASMLVATWFMLRDGTPWNDLGVDFFDRRDPAKSARRLTRRLEALGYQVAISRDHQRPNSPRTSRPDAGVCFPVVAQRGLVRRRFASYPVGARVHETSAISRIARERPPSVDAGFGTLIPHPTTSTPRPRRSSSPSPTRPCSPSNAPSIPCIPPWLQSVLRTGNRGCCSRRERLAVQVLDATDQLTALLREYLDSVRFDIADLDEDLGDPF